MNIANRKTQMVLIIAATASVLAAAVPAMAEEHCEATRETWQPREAAQAAAEALGWQVRRVRSDDGCYAVYARDRRGNRIEASFDPATLQLRSIEVQFAPGGSLADLCATACQMPVDATPAPPPASGGAPLPTQDEDDDEQE